MEQWTFRIPMYLIDELQAALEVLAKKARKLGVSEPTCRVGESRLVKRGGRQIEIADVVVSGERPQLSGWTFAGAAEPVQGEMRAAILKIYDGALSDEEVLRLKQRDATCDHCHKNRARAQVFIVKHPQEGIKVVGRSCLKDFMGHKDAADIAVYFAALDDMVQLYSGDFHPDDFMGRAKEAYAPLNLLAAAVSVVRQRGVYTSAQHVSADTQGEFMSTPDAARAMLSLRSADSQRVFGIQTTPKGERYGPFLKEEVSEGDVQQAQVVLDWVRGLSEQDVGANTYLHNLTTVLAGEVVREKHAAIAASAVSAFARAQVKAADQPQTQPPVSLSQHVGSLKERLRGVSFTLTKCLSVGDRYNPYFIYVIQDEQGNVFKLPMARKLHYDNAQGRHTFLAEGDKGKLTGTVEAHDEYKGTKQTILKRVVLDNVQM